MSKEEKQSVYLVTADIYLRFPEIMKEEADDLAEFLEDEHIIYEGATDVFMDLERENHQLKEKINMYENPEDLTLFYMWLDEKAKDKMKELEQRIDKAIEYIEKQIPIVKNEMNIPNINTATSELLNYEQLLEILKGKE